MQHINALLKICNTIYRHKITTLVSSVAIQSYALKIKRKNKEKINRVVFAVYKCLLLTAYKKSQIKNNNNNNTSQLEWMTTPQTKTIKI